MSACRSGSRRGAAPSLGRRSGFSFVDLLVTMTLVSILAAVGTPILYPALVEFRLNSAGEEVLGAVEYARARAVVAGTQTRVTFDPVANTVLVEERRLSFDLVGGAWTDLTAAQIETLTFRSLEHPTLPGEVYQVTLASEGWSGAIDLISADFGGRPDVTFDSRGAPSSGGTIQLGTDQGKATYFVDAGTGRMSR